MINTTVTTVYVSDDGEEIEIPFTPCDHLYGLPNDGVVNDKDEILFAVEGFSFDSFEDIMDDENVVIKNFSLDRNFSEDDFKDFTNEMTSKDYVVYPVGKYDHGYVQYSIHTHARTDWDYGLVGLIAVNKSIDDTSQVAINYLDYYTEWANGNIYTVVRVPKDKPDNYDCVGGFLGSDDTVHAVLNGDF